LAVITDSGGVQEEALTLGVPTVTVRYNTERPETVFYGINVLAGTETKSIYELTIDQIQKREEIKDAVKTKPNPFGDGNSGRRIAATIKDVLETGIKVESSDTGLDPYIVYALIDSEHLKELDNTFEVIATYNEAGYPKMASKYTTPSKGKTLVRAPLTKLRKLSVKTITPHKTLQRSKLEVSSGEA